MKKNLFLLLAIAITGLLQNLSAQDTIYKTNRDIIVAKVQEVGTYDVKYKRYSSPDGPVYIVRKTEILKIVYADGSVEYFNRRGTSTGMKPITINQQRPWSVSVNVFDLMFSMVSVSGEYNLNKSGAVIRVPVSVGMNSLSGRTNYNGIDGNYYDRNKIFSAGLDILYFPLGRGRVANYYLGIATEYGLVSRRVYVNSYPYYNYSISNYGYGGAGIVNGVQFQISDRINIAFDMTLGFQFAEYNYNNDLPLARFGFLMGWRFGKMPEENTAPAK